MCAAGACMVDGGDLQIMGATGDNMQLVRTLRYIRTITIRRDNANVPFNFNFNLPESLKLHEVANFLGLVLLCIEAKFCK